MRCAWADVERPADPFVTQNRKLWICRRREDWMDTLEWDAYETKRFSWRACCGAKSCHLRAKCNRVLPREPALTPFSSVVRLYSEGRNERGTMSISPQSAREQIVESAASNSALRATDSHSYSGPAMRRSVTLPAMSNRTLSS